MACFLTDTQVMQHGNIPNNMSNYTILMCCLTFTLIPSCQGDCVPSVEVELTGSQITDIPSNLSLDTQYLRLYHTGITILNLSTVAQYPVMCWLEVIQTPLTDIITPVPPESVALTRLELRSSGRFSTPPDLGSVLTGQLEFLTFSGLRITEIPDNYFQNYSNLLSLSLAFNPITHLDLNAGSLAGLSNLNRLYLGGSDVNPLPPLHQWLPKLDRIDVPATDITELPPTLLENLPGLRYLDLKGNQLQTVPDQEYFINLQNMVFIKLVGNPLHCDSNLCWIKVTVLWGNDW